MKEKDRLLTRLERGIDPINLIDPFKGSKGFNWLLERSVQFEKTAKTSAVERINKVRDYWTNLINENYSDTEKDKKLFELETRWKKLKRGGKEEQFWVEEAIGITAAFFEKYQKARNPNFIKLYDNQLYYAMLMCLGQGKFANRLEIALKKHGVNLDTGEGKTISTAIVTAVRSIRGETVHIIEQNYLSAISHAREIAPFHNQFLHKDVSVITDVSGFENNKEKEEKFTVLPTGEIVEKGKAESDYRVNNDGIIVKEPKYNARESTSFIFRDGLEEKITDWEGRANCWLKPIVYCDFNSLGGDIAKDRMIHLQLQPRFGPPDISKATAIVQEADALMFDWASTQFIIADEPKKGLLAWMDYADLAGFKDSSQSFKKAAYFFWDVWRLITQIRRSAFESKFYKTPEGNIYISQETIDVVQGIIEDKFKDFKELYNILKRNQQIIKAAIEIYLGYKPREKYISGEEAVLLDRYNLPLDRRELTDFYNLFLQFSNLYDQKGFFEKPPNDVDFDRLIEESFFSIKSSSPTLARVLPTTIFNEYGNLVFTSGSLFPLSSYFFEIYGAEVLGVGRHEPLKEKVPSSNNCLYTKTLDGGIAEINFVNKDLQPRFIYEIINKIVLEEQAGLIIMPDIESAYQLNQALTEFFIRENILELREKTKKRQIKVITGQEEYRERGLLNKIVTDLKPGDIIITTQMAHRDVDPRPDQELINNGGYETIVCDPPNERGMWQALQRTVRFNTPGKRRLIISDEEVERVAKRTLLSVRPISIFDLPDKEKLEKQHQERQSKFKKLWQKALKGDLESQKNLFFEYLNYLRFGESRIADQIISLDIRDFGLEKWRRLFINRVNRIINRKNWRREIEILAAYELGLLEKITSLKAKSYQIMSDQERRDIEAFILRQGEIKERIIRMLWDHFLDEIDKKYLLFRIAPYNELSGEQPISSENTMLLKSTWDNIVKDIIGKYDPGYLFSSLKNSILQVKLAPRIKRKKE